jgi:hypothetical protein
MQNPTITDLTDITYFQTRCSAIGLTPERNVLKIKKYPAIPDSPDKATEYHEYPLMVEDPKTGDILIQVYDIKGEPATYYKDNPGKLMNGRSKLFEIRRYKPGNERKTAEGKLIKYDTPKGTKTIPWISPNVIEAHLSGTDINTIVITEGYIKAISGWLNGLHIFGLSGIQNYKDKDTGTLHPDILETIEKCHVNNVILLYDGDCTNISLNALNEGHDLYQRPAGFFYSARKINELLKDHRQKRHFDVYFAHVNTSDEITAKGLDDLFEEYPKESDKIVRELTSFSKDKGNYFKRINITAGLSKVLNHLHISTQEVFYTAHGHIINEKAFVFNGTKYQFDIERKELKVIIPGAARNYFRVGDNYFEKIHVPNKYGVLEYRYDRRQKGTIIEDHGKHLTNHVPKYKAFCIKPDHVNYQEIIDNCFNRYRPFEHLPSNDHNCPEIINFLKHIFGSGEISHTVNDQTFTCSELDLGLDYLQLLYQQPTQILPILCLVSRENNTGKSTFGKLLKAIFTGNMAIIGNADLENDFNAGWADKLLICCEESFIDKRKTVEKIKSLSTGDKIQINQKGIDQVEIDFFGKFLFMSNNENNFVIANEYDERFWVRRVPKAEKERTNLLEIMIDEIPNFLYYLNSRILVSKRRSRMHFAPQLLRTDALAKLIEGNKSGPQKEITTILSNLFVDMGFWQLKFTLKYLCETLLRNKYDRNYIARLLKENFNQKAGLSSIRFVYPEIQKQHVSNNSQEEKIIMQTALGKPYTFNADQFLSAEDITELVLSENALFVGQGNICPADVYQRSIVNQQIELKPEEIITEETKDDLPF